MSLDDTLQAAFETLSHTVSETLVRQVHAANEQVRAAVALERRLMLEPSERIAVTGMEPPPAAGDVPAALAPAGIHRAAYDEGFDTGQSDGWDTGRKHGVLEGRHEAFAEAFVRELAAAGRLIDSIARIDGARTLPETLDVLLHCVTREATRAAILIVRDTELEGWKFIGFGARTENPTEFRQAIVGAGVIEEAIRTGAAASTDGKVRVPAPAFAELPLGRRAVGVPIAINRRVVAVLYADQGMSANAQNLPATSEGAGWPAVIEVMARHASRCLEAASASASGQTHAPGAAAPLPQSVVAGGEP